MGCGLPSCEASVVWNVGDLPEGLRVEASDVWEVGDLPEGLRVEASNVWDVGDQSILQHEQPPVHLLRDGHQVPDSSIEGGCRRQTGKVASPIAT